MWRSNRWANSAKQASGCKPGAKVTTEFRSAIHTRVNAKIANFKVTVDYAMDVGRISSQYLHAQVQAESRLLDINCHFAKGTNVGQQIL
jgi:hypothetical protein